MSQGLEVRELPGERRGSWGSGAVHHVAFRVEQIEAVLPPLRLREPQPVR